MVSHKAPHSAFSIVELIIVLVIVVAIGALGTVFLNSYSKDKVAGETTIATDVKIAPESIDSESDLSDAEKMINEVNLDSEDSDFRLIDDHLTVF